MYDPRDLRAEFPSLAPPFDLPVATTGPELNLELEDAGLEPGTLQIEIVGNTGLPILSPLPSPSQALILTNQSGGQMESLAATPSGTVSVIVPDGGTVALAPNAGVPAVDTKISAIMRIRVVYRNPPRIITTRQRRVLKESAGRGGDAMPANGSFPISLNGQLG